MPWRNGLSFGRTLSLREDEERMCSVSLSSWRETEGFVMDGRNKLWLLRFTWAQTVSIFDCSLVFGIDVRIILRYIFIFKLQTVIDFFFILLL